MITQKRAKPLYFINDIKNELDYLKELKKPTKEQP